MTQILEHGISGETEVRGMLAKRGPQDIPGFLIQDHPSRAAKIIIQQSTGKTLTVGYYASSEVLEALLLFF